ncbi:cache domain-containing protein [Nitrosospira multiformis]|nr:cache domain-containing protein [Nitrosospira multiformis]
MGRGLGHFNNLLRKRMEVKNKIRNMNLRKKIILFAVVPLLLALLAIALTIHFQSTLLMQQQHMSIEPFYRASKEVELKNYVALAEQAIAPFYEGTEVEEVAKEKARALLKKMKFGDDGYFFVNDFDGKIIVQPNQPEREGKNEIDRLIIQKLISLARNGGGFVEYTMEKPSVKQIAPKLGYVIALPKWGWVLGTGIYLDDVDSALGRIDTQVSVNVTHTMLWIIVISFLSVIVIFLGLVRNITERTVLDDRLGEANSNLAALTQRLIDARAEEDKRIKYVHGGIQSMLTAIKVNIEAAVKALPQASRLTKESAAPFSLAATQLGGVLSDLRKIVKGTFIIDPNLPLSDQLNKLTLDMSTVATPIEFTVVDEIKYLPLEVKEALFMSAKTALENIIKHAGATRASVLLKGTTSCVKMEIRDDGKGFDTKFVYNNPNSGIGLRSMKEDLKVVGGKLAVTSSPSKGTCLVATVPYP